MYVNVFASISMLNFCCINIQYVKMETYACWMVILLQKVEWKYVMTMCMGRCVMTSGDHLMLL